MYCNMMYGYDSTGGLESFVLIKTETQNMCTGPQLSSFPHLTYPTMLGQAKLSQMCQVLCFPLIRPNHCPGGINSEFCFQPLAL